MVLCAQQCANSGTVWAASRRTLGCVGNSFSCFDGTAYGLRSTYGFIQTAAILFVRVQNLLLHKNVCIVQHFTVCYNQTTKWRRHTYGVCQCL